MSVVITAIDLADEIASSGGITLTELAHQHRTNPSTTFRWAQKGLPSGYGVRIRLEAIKRGKKWLTSQAAVKRFFAALPASTPAPTAPPIRTPSKRERDCDRAKKQLSDKFGI